MKDIVLYLNGLSQNDRNCVVEIGTGLGDIIRKLHFNYKIGYDREPNVLAASRFLSKMSGDRTTFDEFIFPGALNGQFNVILMVNWIHHIEPDVLRQYVAKFFQENLLENGCIVVDTVQSRDYKYNHDIRFLISDLTCKLVKIGDDEHQRETFAIFK